MLTNMDVYLESDKRKYARDCPSGQLSKKKFIEVYSGFFPDGNAEEFCTHVFRTFDKDNSGKIDFKEFLLAINITSGGRPKEKLEWAYQMYDIDGNGTIERTFKAELKTRRTLKKSQAMNSLAIKRHQSKRKLCRNPWFQCRNVPISVFSPIAS
ncbi:hypothetical protein ACTXT7_003039 [Hymenolepis weldensis]